MSRLYCDSTNITMSKTTDVFFISFMTTDVFFISFMTPCFPHNLKILAFPCEFPVRLHNAMVSVSHICHVSTVHARVEREVAWMNLH